MTEDGAFEAYHKALLLPHDEVAFVREFPHKIRDILAESDEITVSRSFLQGSLARGTMVPPLKDGDMVVTLDRDRHGHFMDYPEGSDDSMDLVESVLKAPLQQEFPAVRFVDRSAHALKIDLGDGYPAFDLVSAFEEEEPPGELGNVLIADREDKQFEWSNPRQLRHTVADANQSCEGKLIYVVRMIKSPIKALPELDGFPGLIVEALAYDRLRGSFTLAEGVVAVLDEGAARIGTSSIQEPTKVNDLAPRLDKKGLTDKSREWFTNAATDAHRARSAAEAGDHETAIHWWHRVLGDHFPQPKKSAMDESAVEKVIQDLTYGSAATKPTRAGGEFLRR